MPNKTLKEKGKKVTSDVENIPNSTEATSPRPLFWDSYLSDFSDKTNVTITPTRTSNPIGTNTPKKMSPSLSAKVNI